MLLEPLGGYLWNAGLSKKCNQAMEFMKRTIKDPIAPSKAQTVNNPEAN